MNFSMCCRGAVRERERDRQTDRERSKKQLKNSILIICNLELYTSSKTGANEHET